ncbi:MAG: TonB-dependent receptor [Rikenellaceae bacterium]
MTANAEDILKSDKDAAILVDEIVVTGTGTEHYRKDAPVETEVITRKALEAYQGRDLSEILGGLSTSISFTPSDMGSGLQMGGLGSGYILILLDGKRMNSAASGEFDLDMINPANIERIEIVKGAASSLYGSDAIAGVINIITRKNLDDLSLTNNSRVGAHKDIQQSDIVGFKWGKLNSQTSASYKHTDGWQNTDKEYYHYEVREGSVTKTVNESTSYTFAQKLNYKVDDRLTLTADGSYFDKKNSRPYGAYKYYAYSQSYANFSTGVGGSYKLNDRDVVSLDATFGRNNFYYDYHHQETTDFFDVQTGLRITRYPGEHILETSIDQLLVLGKGVFRLNDHHTMSSGVEYKYVSMLSPRRIEGGEGSTYSISVYGQDEWRINDGLIATIGANIVASTFAPNLSPKISLMKKLGDVNLRATYSRGYKAPTIKQLYDDYIASIGGGGMKHYYGDEDLKPQTSNYYSTGAEYRNGRVKMSLTAQYNQIRNMIALVEVPMSQEDIMDELEASMQYANLSRANSLSIDFDLSYTLLKSLSVGGGYTYTDAEAQYVDDPDSEDFMKYYPINGTSNHKAKCRVAWSYSRKRYKLNVDLFGEYQSERYYMYDGNGAAYQLWKLNTRHGVVNNKHCTMDLNVGIDNIFDYVDETPFGFHRGTNSPGRTLYASLNIKLKK